MFGVSVPNYFNDSSPKCVFCDYATDINAMGDLVCLGPECGEKQCDVFDFFNVEVKKDDSSFNISTWRAGGDAKCDSCGKGNLFEDDVYGNIVCDNCGLIVSTRLISEEQDWNNYESNRESGQDNSRVGWYDASNPYTQLGSTIKSCKASKFTVRNAEGRTVVRDLAHSQKLLNSDSKEKSFYEVIKKLDALTYYGHFSKRVVNLAKVYWNEVVKQNRIFRGGNRNGIIACCVLYACYETNTPMDRDTISKNMFIPTDDIVKGEPILKSILQDSIYKDVLQKSPNVKNNFIPLLQKLGLPVKVSGLCQRVLSDCDEDLSEISAQSATGGIIAFVVIRILKKKKPTKKEIAEIVGVSVPTITNSMKIINSNVDPDDYA